MAERSRIRARAAEMRGQFEGKGATVVEPPVLQPADTLLDLYGEDIRARAYVTSDALRGEQMLRPDFTVPVVQMHMDEGAEPARYTYGGEVFRRQEDDLKRASEYMQVGYEVFDRTDPAAADAEVFSLIASALEGLPVTAVTGDIGVLMAAVAGLDTSDARKAALMRHIWRPARFRQVLERFARPTRVSTARQKVLDGDVQPVGPLTGKRSQDEINARIAALREDAETAPITLNDLTRIEALLDLKARMPEALELLHDLAEDMPAIGDAVARVVAREAALVAKGINTAQLMFEASYGRVSMEYYDGFVFGFRAAGRPDLPTIASGGRYDALTRRLGNGAEIPAVGGVLRPDLVLELEDAL